jgi:hypothetical protein
MQGDDGIHPFTRSEGTKSPRIQSLLPFCFLVYSSSRLLQPLFYDIEVANIRTRSYLKSRRFSLRK